MKRTNFFVIDNSGYIDFRKKELDFFKKCIFPFYLFIHRNEYIYILLIFKYSISKDRIKDIFGIESASERRQLLISHFEPHIHMRNFEFIVPPLLILITRIALCDTFTFLIILWLLLTRKLPSRSVPSRTTDRYLRSLPNSPFLTILFVLRVIYTISFTEHAQFYFYYVPTIYQF